MNNETIGIICPTADYHGAAVSWALKRLNLSSAVIAPAEVGARSISVRLDCDRTSILLKPLEGQAIDLLQVKAFWFRRTAPIPKIERFVHAADLAIARSDWQAHYRSVLFMIANAGIYCLNHPFTKSIEDKKPYQLQVAKQVGLKIPRTYIGNDLENMRQFFAGEKFVAFKTLTENSWPADGTAAGEHRESYTQRIDIDSELWQL